jgi:hypothetical protein
VGKPWFLVKPWSGAPLDGATHSLEKSTKERLRADGDEIDLARSDMQGGDAFHAVFRAHKFAAVSAGHAPVTSLRLNPKRRSIFRWQQRTRYLVELRTILSSYPSAPVT